MIQEQIQKDFVVAMKSQDKVALTGLRGLKTALSNAQIDKGSELTDEEVQKVVQKEIKKRKESSTVYRDANRPELADIEEMEAKLFEVYLPKQMSVDEVRPILEAIIAEVGATSVKDMGKVMGMATKQLAGKCDNKTIGDLIKSLLA